MKKSISEIAAMIGGTVRGDEPRREPSNRIRI